jgi:hypothetical protein
VCLLGYLVASGAGCQYHVLLHAAAVSGLRRLSVVLHCCVQTQWCCISAMQTIPAMADRINNFNVCMLSKGRYPCLVLGRCQNLSIVTAHLSLC